MHVHEDEEYANDELLCILKGLDLICEDCHAFYHIGRTMSVLNDEQLNKLRDHFMKVNNCSEKDFNNYLKSVLRKYQDDNFEFVKKLMTKNKNKGKTSTYNGTILNKVVLFRVEGDIPFKRILLSN